MVHLPARSVGNIKTRCNCIYISLYPDWSAAFSSNSATRELIAHEQPILLLSIESHSRLTILACLSFGFQRIVKRCVTHTSHTNASSYLRRNETNEQWAARPCVFGDEKSQRLRDKWNQNDFCSSFLAWRSSGAAKDLSLCPFACAHVTQPMLFFIIRKWRKKL